MDHPGSNREAATDYDAAGDATPSCTLTPSANGFVGFAVELKPAGATASAAITGTATATIDEADIVAGGDTIIITLTGDTWVTAGATFNAQRQNIIDGLDAASSPTNGWNNEVRDNLAVTTVVRTSDTIATITLSAQAGYDISSQEVITVTIPNTALVTSVGDLTGVPTFTVDEVAPDETITADSGSYSLTGTTISLLAAFNTVTDSGSYALTGTTTPLTAAFNTATDSGSYALTGTATPLTASFNLTSDTGSYVITGTETPLTASLKITSNTDSYLISGTAIPLAAAFNLTAETGSYLITGTDINLSDAESLTVESGSYAVTGTAVNLIASTNIVSDSGSYEITGTDVGLRFGSALALDSGSYLVTGTDVDLTILAKLTAAPGSYLITGTDITLVTDDDIWIPISKATTVWTNKPAAT